MNLLKVSLISCEFICLFAAVTTATAAFEDTPGLT